VREAFDANGAVVSMIPHSADLAIINSCTVTNESGSQIYGAWSAIVAKSGPRTNHRDGMCAALDNGVIAACRPCARRGECGTGTVLARGIDDVGAQHAAPHLGQIPCVTEIQDGCDEHCTFCATTLAPATIARARGRV